MFGHIVHFRCLFKKTVSLDVFTQYTHCFLMWVYFFFFLKFSWDRDDSVIVRAQSNPGHLSFFPMIVVSQLLYLSFERVRSTSVF